MLSDRDIARKGLTVFFTCFFFKAMTNMKRSMSIVNSIIWIILYAMVTDNLKSLC